MIIAGVFSFNGGQEYISSKYKHLLNEIEDIVSAVDANQHKTKTSREKTMPGRILFNPKSLNIAFKREFYQRKWQNVKVKCDYPTGYYTKDYEPKPMKAGAFREMDFVKEGLGVEVQFGKYAFMVYNVCAKMTIFNKMGLIDVGLEIVPIKEFADEMSTGVSYFEQFVWDLEKRGVSNIDIPVLILGIAA
ncbi:MAG: restriction endonuclease [Dehalococcoidia bacterium]|nr:MAG: restriction endonuclease [Dehalococcoidia bacterium]